MSICYIRVTNGSGAEAADRRGGGGEKRAEAEERAEARRWREHYRIEPPDSPGHPPQLLFLPAGRNFICLMGAAIMRPEACLCAEQVETYM